MKTRLGQLSGSELRKLALEEIRHFILLLDAGTPEALESKREFLESIFAHLSNKEQEEFEQIMSLVTKIPMLQKSA